MRALIVINRAAHRYEALRRFARVQHWVDAHVDNRVIALDSKGGWRRVLDESLREGVRVIVAAGGDGTVNAVANALVDREATVPLEDIRFGAIGLGSSNDFQKPATTVQAGIPLRLNYRDCAPRDLARATWVDEDGVTRNRCFVVSASMGATAAANRRFSDGAGLSRWLGARSVDAAIAWAAARMLATHVNIDARITIGDRTQTCALSNLSVMKTQHLSGSFRYDTPVHAASGELAVNLCEDMGRARLLRTLISLMFGRFVGLPKTRHWSLPELEVSLSKPSDLELDGELFVARRVRFDVLNEQLMVCS